MKETLSVLAGLLYIVGFIPYIRSILRKETKPAKASWIIWASIDSTVFAGMYAEKAVNGQIVAVVIGVWIIAVLALKYGIPGWTRIDKFCLGGAVLDIILWRIFENPILGIIIGLSLGSLGSIPTFTAAWSDPSRENRLAWTIYSISCVPAVISIPHWTLADAAQPINFLVLGIIMMYILHVRPRLLAAV